MINSETGYEKAHRQVEQIFRQFSQPEEWLHAKARSVCAT